MEAFLKDQASLICSLWYQYCLVSITFFLVEGVDVTSMLGRMHVLDLQSKEGIWEQPVIRGEPGESSMDGDCSENNDNERIA